jgi:hypothetical protein
MKPLFYFLLLVFVSFSCGSSEVDQGINDSLAGSYSKILTINDFLYAINNSELATYNVSDKSNPVLVNKQDVGFNIENIYLSDGILFIGSSQRLFIYELNSSGIPVLKNSVAYFADIMCSSDPVIVSKNIAYITLSPATIQTDNCWRSVEIRELRIYDVSNVEIPKLLSTFPMSNPKGLTIDNNILFVCEQEKGVVVLDVSNNKNPQQLKALEGFYAYDVIVRNKILYVVGKDEIREYDYSDITNIHMISNISL